MASNPNIDEVGSLEAVSPEQEKAGIPGAETPEKRKKLATLIGNMINSGLSEHQAMTARWDRNQKYYNNNPDSKAMGNLPFPNAADHHAPLVQPVIDLIVETIAQPIIEAVPYWNAVTSGPSAVRVREVEQDLAYLARCAGFETMVYEALTMSAITGIAMVRVPFEIIADGFTAAAPTTDVKVADIQIGDELVPATKVAYCGPVFEVWHPQETVVYPLAVKELERARLIGHSYEWRVQEVREWQVASRFFNDQIVHSGDDAPGNDAGRDSDSDLTTDDQAAMAVDQMVRIDMGLVKLDLDEDGIEEVYQYAICKGQDILLDLMPYEMRSKWYVPIQLHTEHNAFYPSFSIADHLQRTQSYYNEMFNLFLDGSQMGAFPTTFAKKGMATSEMEKTAPGQIVYTDEVPEIAVVPVVFNPGPVASMAQMLKEGAYESAGISSNDQGQSMGPDTTATEAVRVASFSNRRTTGYREKASKGLEKIGYLILGHYRDNYDILKQVHGDRLLCESVEVLYSNFHLTVAGATMSNTPVQQVSAIQMIMQALPQIQQIDPLALAGIDIPQLLRSLIQASQLPNQDAIIRSNEETDMKTILMQIQQVLMMAEQAIGEVEPEKPDPEEEPPDPAEEQAAILTQALQQIAMLLGGGNAQGGNPGNPGMGQ